MPIRWRTLDGKPPRLIAHRGASGERPEHTLAGYELAIAQGADLIEPDLVPTRDGVLLARHDRLLARSTDIARRPGFAALQRDGDWPVDAFDAQALATLRAIQPFPGRSSADDGRWPIPTLDHVLDLLERARTETRADLMVYPELKHPHEFAEAGLDVVSLFVDTLLRRYPSGAAPVWLQCFDRATLHQVQERYALRCHWLLDEAAALALDEAALAALAAAGIAGLGVAKRAVIDAAGRETGLVDRAHAQGLVVHAWTYRDDRVAEPFATIAAEYQSAFASGVDALFCDFPRSASSAREAFEGWSSAG